MKPKYDPYERYFDYPTIFLGYIVQEKHYDAYAVMAKGGTLLVAKYSDTEYYSCYLQNKELVERSPVMWTVRKMYLEKMSNGKKEERKTLSWR